MSNAQRSFHVAVVGATGAVGETMLSIPPSVISRSAP